MDSFDVEYASLSLGNSQYWIALEILFFLSLYPSRRVPIDVISTDTAFTHSKKNGRNKLTREAFLSARKTRPGAALDQYPSLNTNWEALCEKELCYLLGIYQLSATK